MIANMEHAQPRRKACDVGSSSDEGLNTVAEALRSSVTLLSSAEIDDDGDDERRHSEMNTRLVGRVVGKEVINLR